MTPCLRRTEVSRHSRKACSALSTILTMDAWDVSGTRVSMRWVEGSLMSIHDCTSSPTVHSPPIRLGVFPPVVVVPFQTRGVAFASRSASESAGAGLGTASERRAALANDRES